MACWAKTYQSRIIGDRDTKMTTSIKRSCTLESVKIVVSIIEGKFMIYRLLDLFLLTLR